MQTWKIVQLALLTLWNVAARSTSVESHVAQQGVALALVELANAPRWPHSLRFMAAGFLASLYESAAAGMHTGGLVPVTATYIGLINTKVRHLSLSEADLQCPARCGDSMCALGSRQLPPPGVSAWQPHGLH